MVEGINIKNKEQTQKILNFNEKIDNYNKKVKKGDEYKNIINYGVFEASKNFILGFFSHNKEENLTKDDKIIQNAKNQPNEKNKNIKVNNNDNINEKVEFKFNEKMIGLCLIKLKKKKMLIKN